MISRVVFDTNILYSAIWQPQGLPAKAVDLITAGLVIPCVSDAVLAEYREVLLRPKLDLHEKRRHQVLEVFSTLSLHVSPIEVLKISGDPDATFSTNARPRPWPTTTARQLLNLVATSLI